MVVAALLSLLGAWVYWAVAVLEVDYGVRISVMPVVLIEVFGSENLGAVFGIFFTASAASALGGPLLASLIIDVTDSYLWGIAFALALGIVGFAVVVPLKVQRRS